MMIGEDKNLEIKTALNLVLYELYHLDSIKEVKFDERGANYYMRMPLEKRVRIKKALDWALENKGHKFNESLSNLSHIDNGEIIRFLTIIKNGFEEFNVIEA
ncbi:MAG: hypothetical protein WBA20_19550 [Ketobacter sp.]